jgi:hypothetical protein
MSPEPGASGWSKFWGTACSGGTACQFGSGSASISDMQDELSPTHGNIYSMMQWAVKQAGPSWFSGSESKLPPNLEPVRLRCKQYGEHIVMTESSWPGGNRDPNHTYPGGPLLKQINQKLCNHTTDYLVGQFFAQGWTSVPGTNLGYGSDWGCE